MAYPDPKKEKELKQRYNQFTDMGGPDFQDKTLNLIERDFGYFLRDAGIPLGPDRKVPETGGVPRIFVMGVDANGAEKPMSLAEAGLDLKTGNRKFWDQVAMGNVFAYPAGSDDPVQLQADPKEYLGGFSYSKPVAPDKMPARQVQQPGFFARLMHRISGGRFYKEVAIYNDQQNKTRGLETRSKLESMKASRDLEKGEETVVAEEIALENEKKAHQAKLDEKLQAAKDKVSASADGYKIFHSVYKPVPEKHEYLRKDVKAHKSGLYTDKHFASLKVFSKDELDLSKIALAPKGKIGPSVSEKDFCAVAMFAGMRPEVAEKGYLASPELASHDIHEIDSLQQVLGISKEQARQIAIERQNGSYTTDLFIVPASRDNNGTYFKHSLNAARQDAADAFNAYKEGNKEPLAKLIAYGIKRTCRQMVSIGGVPGNEAKGCLQMGLHLTTIMDKDPELKKLAFENGMSEKQLKSVEAMGDYLKMDAERNSAELKLAEAAAKGVKLSGEEKEACMKSIIKAKLVDNIWLNEATQENQKTQEIEDKMLDNMVPVPEGKQELWKEHPEKRPAPPKGKIWGDTAPKLLIYAKQPFRETPPVIGTLKDQSSLDEIVERMVKEDIPAGKSPEELLDLSSKMGSKLPARSMQIAEDIKNEKLLGLNGGPDVQNVPKEPGKKQPADEYDIDLDKPLNIDEEIGGKKAQAGPQL